MDPWSYSPDGRSVVFANEFDSSPDSFASKTMPECNQKPSNLMANDMFMSEFADRGFSDMVPKPFQGNSIDFSADSTTKLASSSSLFATSLLSEENYLSSKFPSFPSHGIDLTSRSHIDYMNSSDDAFGNDTSVIASDSPAKKPRAANSCSHRPSCQVLGCDMDLSSSKEYHRRHRVCEAHSKFPVVVVDGIEQRFCQQCSRFHVLSEFDERKRSCRRRLRGHNERRRKPSVYLVSNRGRTVFLPSNGTKFLETSLAKDLSLDSPEKRHESLVYRVINEQNRRSSRQVKFEDKDTYPPHTLIRPANAQNGVPSHHRDHLSQGYYLSDPTMSSSEFTVALASDFELQEVSGSTRALSLLSQHVPGTPSASFSFARANGDKGPTRDQATGVLTARTAAPAHDDRMESLFIGWGKNGQFFSGSSSCLSLGTGSSTVDLLQLSSHLQRVEQQRNSAHVGHEEHDGLRYFLGL